DEGSWKCWSVAGGEAVPVLPGMEGWAGPMRYSADGRWLAVGRKNDTVQVWDLTVGKVRHTFPGIGRRRGYSCLAFEPAGKRLAASQADRSATVWNLETGAVETAVPVHPADISTLTFSPDGKTLATGTSAPGAGNQVRLWHAITGQPQGELRGRLPPVRGICF